MQFYKFPGDGKSDAAALVDHGAGDIILKKTFEYFFLFVFLYSDASVFYRQLEESGLVRSGGKRRRCRSRRQPSDRHGYPSMFMREFKGIREQVEEDPFQLILIEGGIESGYGRCEREIDVLFPGDVGERERQLFNKLHDIPSTGIQS